MERKKLIAANWKMNKTAAESKQFADEFKKLAVPEDKEVVICAPFTALPALNESFAKTKIGIGAQNIHFEESGAYTGEVSASMVKELAQFVIIGHSERRQYFGETNETLNKKIKKALEHDLSVIFCIGETLSQREKDETKITVEKQVIEGLKDTTPDQMNSIIIAYEPVWAIGTGKTATPQQAEEVHAFIRSVLEKNHSKKVAEKTRILYGGSMNAENAQSLLLQKNIDGGLIGGASLDPQKFAKICNS